MNAERRRADQAIARELIGWSSEVEDRLIVYEQLLRRWQAMMNLVAPSTLESVWLRHFADSAQIVRLAPQARVWVDLGSGAGFPGLVVAIMSGDPAVVHLIESDKRKCAFLREVSRETGAKVVVHDRRIEEVAPSIQGRIDAVSARALAPMSGLLRLAQDFLLKGAVGIFLKGQDVVDELTSITSVCRFKFDLIDSRTDARAKVVVVKTAADDA